MGASFNKSEDYTKDNITKPIKNAPILNKNKIDIYDISKVLWNIDSKNPPDKILHPFISLLNNYTANRKYNEESYTDNEKLEITSFILSCNDFLRIIYEKVNYDKSYDEFLKNVENKWFELKKYNCLFEHIFVGEIDNRKVQGYHNWIKLKIDIESGIVRKVQKLPSKNKYLECFSFDFMDKHKKISSVLTSISPQYEFSVMTLVLLFGDKKNNIYTDDGDIILNNFKVTLYYTDPE
uniref:EndoU domain-containing protein n=1 Tax=viral metagenome TaxID=1070528 RepID=A0A6C0BE31_9ZZZZ